MVNSIVSTNKDFQNKMERYIYTATIVDFHHPEDGTALPDAYASYDDALAAANEKFNRPWQGHELFLKYIGVSFSTTDKLDEFLKDWVSLPADKKNYAEEGSKMFKDSYMAEIKDENVTQIPIDVDCFVAIYRLKLKIYKSVLVGGLENN